MNTRREQQGNGSGTPGPYPPEFRDEVVRLVRNGRSARSLAREFAPTEQTIRRWVRQADLDDRQGGDGLTTSARNELRRLRRDNEQLRLERDILRKAVVWFARRSRDMPENGPNRRGNGLIPDRCKES